MWLMYTDTHQNQVAINLAAIEKITRYTDPDSVLLLCQNGTFYDLTEPLALQAIDQILYDLHATQAHHTTE